MRLKFFFSYVTLFQEKIEDIFLKTTNNFFVDNTITILVTFFLPHKYLGVAPVSSDVNS